MCAGSDYVKIDRECGDDKFWFRTSTYPGKCFNMCATRYPSHFVYDKDAPRPCYDPADPYVAPIFDDSKPVFAAGIMISGCGHEQMHSAVWDDDTSQCVRPTKH